MAFILDFLAAIMEFSAPFVNNQSTPSFSAKRCQHLSQQMPTLLGIVGHCWMWGGQTNTTLVPNIHLLITATAKTTTT